MDTPKHNQDKTKEIQETSTEAEVFDKEPEGEGMPKAVMQRFEMGIEAIRGQLHPPYMSKIESEHIGKILDNADKSDDRHFIFSKRSQWFGIGKISLGIALFVFLILFLSSDNKDLLADIMKIGIGFVGGTGFGIYLRSRRQ